MKIYTKTGDNGTTGLLTGKRYKKSNAVFDVLGNLDELNASLGLVSVTKIKNLSPLIVQIQSDLFIVGALIAGKKINQKNMEYFETRLQEIEKTIDFYESKNNPLTNFILPGGCIDSIYLHAARAICRKTERSFVGYVKSRKYSGIVKYLNRLSDLLFVLARYANKRRKVKDTVWKGDRIFS